MSDPITVLCKKTYDPIENFQFCSLLPWNMNAEEFLSHIDTIKAINSIPLIHTAKMEDLVNKLDYMDVGSHSFFEEIFID